MIEALTAAHEAAIVRELHAAWTSVNQSYFKSALSAPAIVLVDSEARLGRWLGDSRVIEISRVLVSKRSWGVVLEVLKHEVAHQYVHEALGRAAEGAHGPSFREICDKLGIDGSASGVPIDPGVPTEGVARVLERVAKLLALAGSSNQHEAEAAMNAAQRLMLKHNLDAPSTNRRYGFRHLGRPTGRITEHERLLSGLLARHFFVEAIWVPVWRPLEARRGSVLEVCGTPENLEIASYVYDFLLSTADRLWREYKTARGVRGDRDRRTYIAGVISGFRERLDQQRAENERQALIWVGDADLRRFYRRRHPHIRSVYGMASGPSEANVHGRQAGRNLVLHRGVSESSARGRLLTS